MPAIHSSNPCTVSLSKIPRIYYIYSNDQRRPDPETLNTPDLLLMPPDLLIRREGRVGWGLGGGGSGIQRTDPAGRFPGKKADLAPIYYQVGCRANISFRPCHRRFFRVFWRTRVTFYNIYLYSLCACGAARLVLSGWDIYVPHAQAGGLKSMFSLGRPPPLRAHACPHLPVPISDRTLAPPPPQGPTRWPRPRFMDPVPCDCGFPCAQRPSRASGPAHRPLNGLRCYLVPVRICHNQQTINCRMRPAAARCWSGLYFLYFM